MIGNMTRSTFSLFVAMTLSLMALPQSSDSELAQESEWNIYIVDSTGDVGRYTSIALDSSDCPHISYYDDTNEDLKYAKWTGSGWGIETVDSTGNVGRFTSLALDTSDHPHTSYYDDTNEDLKYAKWTDSGWAIETVDSTGDVGMDTSLALDSSDHPHISYLDRTNVDLKYARWNGSTWNIEAVDSAGSVGAFTSIAIDSNDNPHIAYFDARNGDLKYTWWNGSAWSIEIIDSAGAVGWYTSMALDTTDNPHISYFDVSKKDLKYARWSGSKWIVETLDSGYVGYWTSIALDSSGYPHISYHGDDTGKLKYAMWTGSEWSLETADSRYVGRGTSIALDSSGYPHISYEDYNNRDLKYATKARLGPDNEPPVAYAGPDQTVYVGDIVQFDGSGSYDPDANWTMTSVDSTGWSRHRSSLALDTRDYPHISYHDYDDEILKYAKWTGSSWNIETVDENTGRGWITSIALDSKDHPHIGYLETDNVDLKYAKWDGTAWAIETVDSVGSVGWGVSIAIDSKDNPHIAYSDSTNEYLKYAKWNGSAWSIEVVYSSRHGSGHVSLALDGNDYPHIAYCDWEYKWDLLHVKWNGTAWNIETVDSVGYVGGYNSIVLDSNDNPHISYVEWPEGPGGGHPADLKYAKWNGIAWNIETLVSDNGWRYRTSIALDTRDYPHISYSEPIEGELAIRYTRWTGSTWDIETVDSNGGFIYPSLALDSDDNPHVSYSDSTDLKYAKKGKGIVSYDWDFDDGSPHGSGVNPIHVYSIPGVYDVTLTVTDNQGATDTDNCIVTVLPRNQPPVAEANGPYNGYEGSPVKLNASGSYDPDGDALQYRWDLNNDGIWDTGWSSSPYLQHTWSDDYSGQVAVEVSDGEYTDMDTATVIVYNVAPTVELKLLPMYVNVSLRIAGEKWRDVSIELYEGNILIAQGNLTRYPGSPNDQMLHLVSLTVNRSRTYSAIVHYTPEDDPINGQPLGANPCWIILNFSDVSETRIHHTFNVRHPETYIWQVDLTTTILSHALFEGTAFDPGADDLTFIWDFGDGTSIALYYPNVNNTNPVMITDTVAHTFPGSGTYIVTLTVEDDDGGVGVAIVHIVIP